MHDFLKEQYEFSDYQIAQLKYLFKTVTAEFSKLAVFKLSAMVTPDSLDDTVFFSLKS